VKQFILTQFKYPYYVIYIFLTTDTKLVGSTCFYIYSENPLVMSLTFYPI